MPITAVGKSTRTDGRAKDPIEWKRRTIPWRCVAATPSRIPTVKGSLAAKR